MKAVIRYTLLEDGEIIKTEEKECLFIPKQEEQKTDAVMDIVATEGRTMYSVLKCCLRKMRE
jgi:ribosomal protein L14